MSIWSYFFPDSQQQTTVTLTVPVGVSEPIKPGQIKDKVVTWLSENMDKTRGVKLVVVASMIGVLFLALVKGNLMITLLAGLSLAGTVWLFLQSNPDHGFVLLSKE